METSPFRAPSSPLLWNDDPFNCYASNTFNCQNTKSVALNENPLSFNTTSGYPQVAAVTTNQTTSSICAPCNPRSSIRTFRVAKNERTKIITQAYSSDQEAPIVFSPSESLHDQTSPLPPDFREDFVLSDLAVWKEASMDWHYLDSEQCPSSDSDHYNLPPVDTDWATNQLIDDTLQADIDLNIDINELDEYLYPSSSSCDAGQEVMSTPFNGSGSAPDRAAPLAEDPLVEFFPQLTTASTSTTMSPNASTLCCTQPMPATLPTQAEYNSDAFKQQPPFYSSDSSTSSNPSPPVVRRCYRVGSAPKDVASLPQASVSPRARPYPTDTPTDYRTRRDKNNLASARSRQRRQEKFTQIKTECSQLELRNVELKATLDALEKAVAEYKQIMMQCIQRE